MWEVPELRKLTYAQRAELLGKIADAAGGAPRRVVRDRAQEFRQHQGRRLDRRRWLDRHAEVFRQDRRQAGRRAHAARWRDRCAWRATQNFQGLHVGVPLDGVAVHINAFNFPAWGLWEKAAVSLLAGVPVLSQACDLDGVAGAGDGERRDRGGRSAAGGAVDSVRLAERSARSSAAGRCGRLHRIGRYGRGNSSASSGFASRTCA